MDKICEIHTKNTRQNRSKTKEIVINYYPKEKIIIEEMYERILIKKCN